MASGPWHAPCAFERDSRKVQLDGANLSRMDLGYVKDLSGRRLRGANLSGSDLRGVDLANSDITDACLFGCGDMRGQPYVIRNERKSGSRGGTSDSWTSAEPRSGLSTFDRRVAIEHPWHHTGDAKVVLRSLIGCPKKLRAVERLKRTPWRSDGFSPFEANAWTAF